MEKFFELIRFNWLNTNIIGTIPVFISTNLVAIAVWQLHISQHTMPLILGVIAGGLVDLDNRLSGRLKNLFFTLIAFAISSLSAQLALSYNWLFIPLITLIAFIIVMLGAIGQRYSTIAFGTLLVAVYTTLTYTSNSIWYNNPMMILLGTLVYGGVAVIVHLCFPNRAVQQNMAQYFTALSQYLLAKSAFFDPDDSENLPAKQLTLANKNIAVMATFDRARISLFYRLKGQHRSLRTTKMLRYYFAGQEIWERVSSSHAQYHSLIESLRNSDLIFRLQRILELQANTCREIAHALEHNRAYHYNSRSAKAVQGLMQSISYHQEQGKILHYDLQSTAENLSCVEQQLSQLTEQQINQEINQKTIPSPRLIAENISGLRNMWQAIRSQSHFSLPLFRHAVRLSILVLVSSLAVELFPFEQGYWILLTAILVCQPNYSATKKRLIQRIGGTILGVIIGYTFRYFSPSLEAQLGLIIASSSLFFFFRSNNYSFSTFFITIQVIVSFDITGLDSTSALLPRIIDTCIGAFFAWCAVAYLYPDWKHLNLATNLRITLKNNAIYLRQIIAQLQFGYRNQFSYRIARREAHNSATTLSTIVSNMLNERKKYQHQLEFALNLLGQIYTLLSYISALGTHRTESQQLNAHGNFSVQFFHNAKSISLLLEKMATDDEEFYPEIEQKFIDIEQQIQHEMTKVQHDKLKFIALQQLHLITQSLIALLRFICSTSEKK